MALMHLPRLLCGDVANKIAEAVSDAGNHRGAQPAYASLVVALKSGERDEQADCRQAAPDYTRTSPSHAGLTAGLAKHHAQGRALFLLLAARALALIGAGEGRFFAHLDVGLYS